MQQSSATPSLHLCFLGLQKIVACSQPYLAVLSCIYSFWHGVIPTSYFIFNDFYTCIYRHEPCIHNLCVRAILYIAYPSGGDDFEEDAVGLIEGPRLDPLVMMVTSKTEIETRR